MRTMADGELSGERLDKMRGTLARHVESGAIPGLVALVSRSAEAHVYAIGTMQAGGGAAVRRDTIYRMASLTKPVTAAAVMVLVDECRLRLDDPVGPWLPELADRQVLKRIGGPLEDTEPARRPITVRDLLTLTFGFGTLIAPPSYPIQAAIRELGIASDGPARPGPDEWIRRLGTLPLMYQPGERWLYAIGSDVLGVLIARVTGQSFGAFLYERIFAPLGMNDTGFYVPPDKIDRLPPSYAHVPGSGELMIWDEPAGGSYSKSPSFEAGGSGLVSTADDYHAFYRMLLNHGRHETGRILSRPAVELMTMDHLTPGQRAAKESAVTALGGFDQGGWGFGMGIRTYRRDYAPVGQFGWDGGLGTTAYCDPTQQLTGILLTQTAMDTPHTPRLMQDFWTCAYQVIDD
jgi:CubicO group peptidase (beta-lactamase class C family)